MAQIITGHRVGQDGTIRVGCSAAIFDENREKILLTRREDNNQWKSGSILSSNLPTLHVFWISATSL